MKHHYKITNIFGTNIISTLLCFMLLLLFANKAESTNYFWVGGQGNWSQAAHWSTSSGGSGGVIVPGSTDNIFFDANSGFTPSSNTVTIDVSNAYCKDMTWTGATNYPTLTTGSSAYNLRISGSLTLIAAMNFSFSGATYFEAASTGKTITSAGQTFYGAFYLNASGGEWTLQDDLNCNSTIYLNYGTFRTNNKNITTGNFNTDNANIRGLYLGSSLFTINTSGYVWWQLSNMTLNAGTSTISFPSSSSPRLYLNNTSSAFAFYNIEFTSASATGYLQNTTGQTATYNSLTFAGHGYVYGNSIFNGAVSLTAGKTYQFESGKTQTFNSTFLASGYCGNNVTIQSTSSGSAATFSKSAGSITVDYATLKDNTATGGAVFTANNSTNAGNVTNWTINSPSNLNVDYYWIGGQGNWSQANHWSLSSGGSANPAGCIPGSTNTVHFDAGSGFTPSSNTVTVDVSNASCKDMLWTGAGNYPTFTTGSSAYNLRITGSLTLIAAMNFSFSGATYFEAASTGKTITSAGQTFYGAFYLNASGGEWTLQDDLNCNSTIYLNYGTFRTNNKNITTGNFNTDNANIRGLYLGSSLFTINTSGYVWWQLSNMTLNAGTSTISFPSSSSPRLYLNNTSSAFAFYNIEFTSASATGYLQNTTGQTATYNSLTFAGHGYVYGNSIFNGAVSLTAGKSYQFESGKTQTLNSSFNATGSSGLSIDIKSTSSGSQATLSKASGCLLLDYLQLKDSKATGGANFYAGANSIDLGNNTGWNFTTPPGGNGVLSVSIAASPSGSICSGTTVTFTATTVNGGTLPTYVWKKNGSTVGSNSPVYTDATWTNGDQVYCIVTAASTCVTNNPATSNIITITVSSSLTLSTSITASPSNNVCAGTSVTFTATDVNGGPSPSYQWKLNGSNVGTNSPVYTNATWTNGDQVYCIVTSNLGGCVTGSPANSNTITMNVSSGLPVSVIITANPAGTITAGTSVTFTTSVTNGGTNPSYQWKVNNIATGSNSATFVSNTLLNNDVVTCEVTSNIGACATGNPATSNAITMSVTGTFTFYWIGGSGNWTQATHWSFSSGGPACNLVPGSQNNVFFDANSGFTSTSKTVTIDASNASCRNMDWTNAANVPVLTTTSSSNNLMIYGSLTLI
ncbi:MAG: hypothetical protein WCM76_16440, partial [Bacteroidota bacterium]